MKESANNITGVQIINHCRSTVQGADVSDISFEYAFPLSISLSIE
jgi:hypothetical protein